jgi:hypothetical protein
VISLAILKTIAYSLFGNQTKSLDDGCTIYNFNNNVYKQYNCMKSKTLYSGTPLFEVRRRASIDLIRNGTNITTI